MVHLAAVRRLEYAEHLPFWQPAPDAEAAQTSFFATLLNAPDSICLVHDDGAISGFVIANVTVAPPVYDPGGKGCLIDDFVVSEPDLWKSVGLTLLAAAEARAAEMGAVFSIVVCGQHDSPKREALASVGAYVGTEFHVHAFDQTGYSSLADQFLL
jgi:hypothetical protein